MRGNHRHYEAKQYIAAESAALDPYEEERESIVDDQRLQQWFQHVNEELARYRSPFIASEVLLRELRDYSATLYSPERLYVSTALHVFQACLPYLSCDLAAVAAAAIQELLPAIAYTRFSAASPSQERVVRLTYATSFRRIMQRWKEKQRLLNRHGHLAVLEERVIDRLAHELDRMWVKTCFFAWRTHCRHLRERKQLLRRRLQRGTASGVVPTFIRSWRQYAHSVAQKAKLLRNGKIQREVEALHPLEQEAKSRHDHLTEQVRAKNQLVGNSRQKLDESLERLSVLNELVIETKESFKEHWRTWKQCIQLLFHDGHSLPVKQQKESGHLYLINITDTASLFDKRARSRVDGPKLSHIQTLLVHEKMLLADDDSDVDFADNALNEDIGSSVLDAMVSRTSSLGSSNDPSSQKGGRATQFHFTHHYHRRPTAFEVVAALSKMCHPVVPPLDNMMTLHNNEAQLNITFNFIGAVCSGGHCSLFVHPSPLPQVEVPEVERICSDAPESPSSSKEMEFGAVMVSDVTRGMEKMRGASEMNDQYLLAVRQCMMSSEVELIQGYLGQLYRRLTTLSMPLSREKLEVVWRGSVRPGDFPVVQALYPDSGIHSFADFVSYLMRVAEFSGMALLVLAERIDAVYPYDPLDTLWLLQHSEEAVRLFHSQEKHLVHLANWLNAGMKNAQLRDERVASFLTSELHLTKEEVEDVLINFQVYGGVVVGQDEVQWLLLLAAQHVDPSPFVTPLEKVASVLESCLSFFLKLG